MIDGNTGWCFDVLGGGLTIGSCGQCSVGHSDKQQINKQWDDYIGDRWRGRFEVRICIHSMLCLVISKNGILSMINTKRVLKKTIILIIGIMLSRGKWHHRSSYYMSYFVNRLILYLCLEILLDLSITVDTGNARKEDAAMSQKSSCWLTELVNSSSFLYWQCL